MTRNFMLTLCYDGTRYRGWQRQGNTDNTIQAAELAFYEKLAAAKIPHYGGADSFALNGAFCGYGVDYRVLGKATADMVYDILRGVAQPALPGARRAMKAATKSPSIFCPAGKPSITQPMAGP